MKKIRAIWRLCYFAAYTLMRVSQIVLLSVFKGENIRRSMRIRQRWARHLLPAIGVKIESRGTPPDFPCILMGNHRSYLDPIVILHDTFAYPVSKAEVSNWPIVGYGAKVSGVLFLKRESIASRKFTLEAIAEKLREEFPVILFPEGTTHSEPQTIAFKPGGFRLAAANHIPVVPVAIEYASAKDYWVGNDTFLPHFIRRFGEKNMKVRISYGEAIWNEDPVSLLEEAQSWINGELAEIRREWY
ncbi:MAG: 1-acyl-sn-glycerol-3-phosphate acyltransferase [Saprospiraceae bacterium]|nr:1-acyl-sn-glycerol-3-phosphate acyltransferase [Saprospiraceae bacterium]